MLYQDGVKMYLQNDLGLLRVKVKDSISICTLNF